MTLVQDLEYDVFEPLALEFCARVSVLIPQGLNSFIYKNHNIVHIISSVFILFTLLCFGECSFLRKSQQPLVT